MRILNFELEMTDGRKWEFKVDPHSKTIIDGQSQPTEQSFDENQAVNRLLEQVLYIDNGISMGDIKKLKVVEVIEE